MGAWVSFLTDILLFEAAFVRKSTCFVHQHFSASLPWTLKAAETLQASRVLADARVEPSMQVVLIYPRRPVFGWNGYTIPARIKKLDTSNRILLGGFQWL
jgi:hypothetical protein